MTIAHKTPLAWHNLWHQPVRSGVAVIGVTFAAVLMFMQLGFLEAVKASATVIYDVNAKAVAQVRSGKMPFQEEGADELLTKVMASGMMEVQSGPELLERCRPSSEIGRFSL